MKLHQNGKEIGLRIRETRKQLNLRQADLSEKIGISGSHLSDIERGKMLPTLPTLQRISQALDRPMEYFISDTLNSARTLSMVIPRTLIGLQALEKFSEIIDQKTNGELNIQLYQHAMPNAVYTQVKGLAEGSIHILLDDLLSFEHYAKLSGIAFLPYFFRDREHYNQFLNSSLFKEHIYRSLRDNGIRILNSTLGWEYGSFELLFSRHPVFHPEDMVGKRMRSYASKPANRLRELLNIEPVQVLWGHGYIAFQQNEIDMFLTPAAYVAQLRLHEVADYATIIDYGYTQNLVFAINDYAFQTLSPDIQTVLIDSVDETGQYFSEIVKEQTDTNLERLSSEYSIPVIHPDPHVWKQRFSIALHQMCREHAILAPELYSALQTYMIEANE